MRCALKTFYLITLNLLVIKRGGGVKENIGGGVKENRDVGEHLARAI